MMIAALLILSPIWAAFLVLILSDGGAAPDSYVPRTRKKKH